MKLHHILRSKGFLDFTREFFRVVSQIRTVIGALVLLIVLGGWILHRVESIDFWEAQYLAFITALTIGYGDITPSHPGGRFTCLILGIVGMIAMGLIVGAASVAVRKAVSNEGDKGEERG